MLEMQLNALQRCGIEHTTVLIGFGAATALRNFTSFPAEVQLWVAVLGVGLASSIGLFFGIYPATQAARLDPVVALRSE